MTMTMGKDHDRLSKTMEEAVALIYRRRGANDHRKLDNDLLYEVMDKGMIARNPGTICAFEVAIQEAPDLVQFESPISRFYENAGKSLSVAAYQLERYWEKRMETFTADDGYKPLLVSSLNDSALNQLDVDLMNIGCLRLTCPNNAERPILRVDQSLLLNVDRDRTELLTSIRRCVFYLVQCLSENESARSIGVNLMVVYNLKVEPDVEFDMDLFRTLSDVIKSVPIRLHRVFASSKPNAETTKSVARKAEFSLNVLASEFSEFIETCENETDMYLRQLEFDEECPRENNKEFAAWFSKRIALDKLYAAVLTRTVPAIEEAYEPPTLSAIDKVTRSPQAQKRPRKAVEEAREDRKRGNKRRRVRKNRAHQEVEVKTEPTTSSGTKSSLTPSQNRNEIDTQRRSPTRKAGARSRVIKAAKTKLEKVSSGVLTSYPDCTPSQVISKPKVTSSREMRPPARVKRERGAKSTKTEPAMKATEVARRTSKRKSRKPITVYDNAAEAEEAAMLKRRSKASEKVCEEDESVLSNCLSSQNESTSSVQNANSSGSQAASLAESLGSHAGLEEDYWLPGRVGWNPCHSPGIIQQPVLLDPMLLNYSPAVTLPTVSPGQMAWVQYDGGLLQPVQPMVDPMQQLDPCTIYSPVSFDSHTPAVQNVYQDANIVHPDILQPHWIVRDDSMTGIQPNIKPGTVPNVNPDLKPNTKPNLEPRPTRKTRNSNKPKQPRSKSK